MNIKYGSVQYLMNKTWQQDVDENLKCGASIDI